jgi:hypothetical protein
MNQHPEVRVKVEASNGPLTANQGTLMGLGVVKQKKSEKNAGEKRLPGNVQAESCRMKVTSSRTRHLHRASEQFRQCPSSL